MGKKSKFDKLNEWIKAEYDRETKEIEDSLSNDGSFDPDKIDSEKLFQRIQSRIREREEQEIESGIPKKIWKLSGQQVRKWAALFFVAVIGVFLASMTSEANRSYFMYKVQYLVGDEITLHKGNEKNSNNIIKKDRHEKIREDIGSQLDILIPYFEYKLQLASADSYNIQYGSAIATVEYQYCDNIINLRMVNKNKTDIGDMDFKGKTVTELKIEKSAITMYVTGIRDIKDGEDTLTAQWEYQNGYYQLSGKLEKSEFIKILKSISY